MWTSLSNKSFITVTLHIITPNFEFFNCVLDTLEMMESHTGENISIKLQEIL